MQKTLTFVRALANQMNAGARQRGMVYEFRRGDVTYQAHIHGGGGWDVVSLVRLASGALSWRWAKTESHEKGIIGDVLSAAKVMHDTARLMLDNAPYMRWAVRIECGMQYSTIYVLSRSAKGAMKAAQEIAGHNRENTRYAVEAHNSCDQSGECASESDATETAHKAPDSFSAAMIQQSAAKVDAGNSGTCEVVVTRNGGAIDTCVMETPVSNPLEITVTLAVSDQFLRDVLSTAIEGGSNYWANFSAFEWTERTMGSMAEYKAVTVSAQCECRTDTPDFKQKRITLTELRTGVQVMLERGKCANSYKSDLLISVITDDAGMCDAELSDLILQSAMFDGDVVYG